MSRRDPAMSSGAEFNDLLTGAGIAPSEVCIIRHQTSKPGVGGMSLFELWRDNPAGFKRYQDTQQPKRAIFRNRKIWAGFVSPSPGETLFIGLFDAVLATTRKADWLCDYSGDAPNNSEPVNIFDTRPRPELAELIGRLRVVWPKANVRTWARKADRISLSIVPDVATPASRPLTGARLVTGLEALGFLRRHTTQKLSQFRRGNVIIYVKRETEVRPLVVHPQFLDIISELRSLPGVDLQYPARTYINSNLAQFPVYVSNNRIAAGHHGLAMGVHEDQLETLITLLDDHSRVDTRDGPVRIVAPQEDPLTEKERLQAARIGQGEFRSALMILWNGTCPIAGVDHSELLRASHIKSWKCSSNSERLDPFNGLLLCAHIDALFDRHLISFEDDGQMLISSVVSDDNRLRLGLAKSARIEGLDARHAPYLTHHRSLFRP